MNEQRLSEHHYIVWRWNLVGKLVAHKCFNTSNGAIAFMCNDAPVAYTVACVPRRVCGLCNPSARQPMPTPWRLAASEGLESWAWTPARSSGATPRREFKFGTDWAEERGVYDKQTTGHAHTCTCGTIWGSCYRGDCAEIDIPRVCPWHMHDLTPERVARASDQLDTAFPGWREIMAASFGD